MTLDICLESQGTEASGKRQAVQELKTEIADLKRSVISPAPVTAQNLLPGVNAPTDNGHTAKKLLKHANLIAKVTATGMAVKMKEPVTWAGVPTDLRVTGYTNLEERLVLAGIPLDKCVAFWCARLMLCKDWESVVKAPSSTSESQHSTGAETPVEVSADESQHASREAEVLELPSAQQSPDCSDLPIQFSVPHHSYRPVSLRAHRVAEDKRRDVEESPPSGKEYNHNRELRIE
ncbi:hypothetical protein EC973_000201 [Apophysomyces ossiformis]|uniref:Uncharacterized protein n=1 Tax=Apophysomyces ossiformis TaxID=679940 RepID=A0A8H7EV92_9FUNG|nr:hypothetical protein EC973_000201 [Apophysomyces ossiformis]